MNWLKYSQINSIKPYKYIGQCDRIRKNPDGERFWRYVMGHAVPVSQEEFLNQCDISPLLDENETVEQFLSDYRTVGYYKANYNNTGYYWFGTRGFEFFFKR